MDGGGKRWSDTGRVPRAGPGGTPSGTQAGTGKAGPSGRQPRWTPSGPRPFRSPLRPRRRPSPAPRACGPSLLALPGGPRRAPLLIGRTFSRVAEAGTTTTATCSTAGPALWSRVLTRPPPCPAPAARCLLLLATRPRVPPPVLGARRLGRALAEAGSEAGLGGGFKSAPQVGPRVSEKVQWRGRGWRPSSCRCPR